MLLEFLGNNLIVLFSTIVVYVFFQKEKTFNKGYLSFFAGCALGLITLIAIVNGHAYAPGIVFDFRSVLLCITGMFFGRIAAVIAAGMAVTYEFFYGLGGFLPTFLIICFSSYLGVLFKIMRVERRWLGKVGNIYLFALAVHLVMLVLVLLQPWDRALETYKHVILPVLILHPLCVTGLAVMMLHLEKQHQAMLRLDQDRDYHEQLIRELKEKNRLITEESIQLQLAIQSGNVGFYDWNVQDDSVYFSSIWKRQIGYADDEIINRFEEWESRVHPDDLEATMKRIQRCLEVPDQDDFHSEFRFCHKDGSYRWIMAQGKLLYDNEGKPWRMIGAHIDITDQKQAEKELIDSEKKYRMLFENAVVGLAISTQDGDILEVNNGVTRILGYSKEELASLSGNEIYVDSEDRKRFIQVLEEKGIVNNFEVQFRNKAGAIRWVSLSSRPIRYEGQDAYLTITMDIDDQKKAEGLLRESRTTLNLILDTVPQAIFWKDHVGCYLGCNQVYAKAVGLDSPEEIVGKTDYDMPWSRDEAEAYRAEDRDVLENNRSNLHILKHLQTFSGDRIWVDTSKVPLCDTDGKPFAVLGVYDDITERRRTEEARLKFAMVADSSSEFIGICDLDLNPIYVNPAGLRMVGFDDMAEACQVKVQDYFFPEDQQFIAEEFFPSVLEHGEDSVEIRLRHFKTGEAIWMLYSLFSIRDASDEIVGWATVSRDITERKQVDEALRERDEDLKESQRIAHVGSWRLNLLTNEVTWSEELYKMYGFDPSLPPPSYDVQHDIFTPESWDRLSSALSGTVETGIPYELELETFQKDGSHGWMWVRGEVIRDETGGVVGLRGAAQDITERRRAADALAESELWYRTLFETAAEGIVVSDVKTKKYLYVNPAFCKMFAYSKEELISLGVMDIFAPEDVEYVKSLYESHAKGNDSVIQNLPCMTKDGRKFYANVRDTIVGVGDKSCLVGFFTDNTEKKQILDALEESELWYRTLFETAVEGIVVTDAETKQFLYANTAFCKMLGYSIDELKAMDVKDIHPKDKLDEVYSYYETHARGEKFIVDSLPCQKKTGEVIYVRINSDVIELKGQQCVVAFFTDITQQRDTEEKLSSKEKLLYATSTLANVGGWEFDPRTGEGAWTDETARIHDMDPEVASSASMGLSFYDDANRKIIEDAIHAAVTDGTGYDLELEMKTKEGIRKWVRIIGEPVFQNGECVKIWGVIQDISKQKNDETVLKEREEQLQLKLDSILSPDVNIEDYELENVIDAKIIQSIMENFSEITGLCTAILDLKGTILVATGWQDVCTKFHRVCPESEKNCVKSDVYLTENIERGKFVSYKCYNQMWDIATPLYIGEKHVGNVYSGQFFYDDEEIDIERMLVQAEEYGYDKEAYRDALERVPRVSREKVDHFMQFLTKFTNLISKLSYSNLKLVKSVHDQKLAQDELTEYRDSLEVKVQERTRELELVNKELEAFAYSVSHDLRAPLRAIDGFSKILDSKYRAKLDEKGKDYLFRICRATANMEELISGILKLSRLTRETVKYETINLSEMAKEISANLMQNSDRDVEWIIGPDIHAEADRHLLRAVLENLIGNAWKFTSHHDRARIEFGAEQQDSRYVYYVRDDGAGFNMDYMDKIFGPFQRLHQSSEFQGSGIGLATVQRIIHRHGGEIWAHAEPEKGATFYFTLL